MLDVLTTRQFEKDLKLAQKRGQSLEKLWNIVDALSEQKTLAQKHKPHKLSGNWDSF